MIKINHVDTLFVVSGLVIIFLTVALFLGFAAGGGLRPNFTCEEDEALYPVSGLSLDYPDGDVECVNIEELFNYE